MTLNTAIAHMNFRERLALVKAMHQDMIHMNDEDAYFRWIVCGVPDGAQSDDFAEFASDEDECVYLADWYCALRGTYDVSGFSPATYTSAVEALVA